ncbi:LPXTG cell wall anchor domain-containing protein [Glutamicibacter sp. JL.03c]|uniref:S1 family peptidase n=1 Tax=Glutamicibacter sp. JL.03c TaxID=2984842 RepID=UPI0021F7C875|nr:LPXTG cell wall anchor domain-containing protein [Glutamicibacter sp. JL.03c]UYQ78914.1 LPXTG cell wall anchor domain-containing protein [Glutamicibacter sp. JL.03c]
MPNPNKKTAQRGIVAAAATALVVGSSFMPAVAAPEATSSPSLSASSSEKATPSATTTEGAVDTTGLPEAIERDLGKTVDEFVKDGETSDAASKVRDELKSKGIEATASVKDAKVEITVEKGASAEAKEVIKATAVPAPIVLTEVDSSARTVDKVYTELLANIEPSELKRVTAILRTGEGLKIYAKDFDKKEAQTQVKSKSAGSSSDKLTIEQFVGEANHVEGEVSSGTAKTTAEEDIYGALGYAMDESGAPTKSSLVCSLGFNAWNPSGGDAVISAGHCTKDGAMKILGLAEQSAPDEQPSLGLKLGTFGFSQFGGPNNSGFTSEELNSMTQEEFDSLEPGTDISVIDDINPALNLHPAVSKWADGKAPRDDVFNVTGTSKAVVGSEVCSSGRTTGWSCAEIFGEGVFFVDGGDGTYRSVEGFVSDNPGQNVLDQGDSGGPALVGSNAVGINSANAPGEDERPNTNDDIAMYTSLDDVFNDKYIDGYAVKLFINAPTLTTQPGIEVVAGSEISGNVKGAKSGTQVDVIVDGEVVDTVTVDSNGNFTFSAPDQTGDYEFTLRAHKGFDKSAATQGNVVVVAVPSPSPSPSPTQSPTPTPSPTEEPSKTPTEEPSKTPTEEPSKTPTEEPSKTPTEEPSETEDSSEAPQDDKSDEPTKSATPKETPKNDDPLADTGSSSAPLIAVGGALALVGAMFLLFRRGNRRHG